MLFTVRVAALDQPQQLVDEDLAFVRFYSTSHPVSDDDKSKDLTMQHLVWETKQVKQGKRTCNMPSYGII